MKTPKSNMQVLVETFQNEYSILFEKYGIKFIDNEILENQCKEIVAKKLFGEKWDDPMTKSIMEKILVGIKRSMIANFIHQF